MKPSWLVTLLSLAVLPVTGLCAGAAALPYAIVTHDLKPAVSRIAGLEALAEMRPQAMIEEGQWVSVGENPTFRLQFVDQLDATGTGFDHPVLGQSRRTVAIRAFELVSEILAGEPGTANIRIDSDSPYFDADTLAVGVPFFRCVDGFQKPIIFDALRNDIHVHDFEGELAVNFSLALNSDMAPPPPGQYDLFTVIFHEITHILGFVGFTVQPDGLPLDCGGARMLPTIARYATDGQGSPLWVEQDGEVHFTGPPEQVPTAAEPVPVEFPGAVRSQLHLATGELRVSGHWLPEDFANRTGVLMLREPFPSGETRRNMTPETKTVLETALEFNVNEDPRGLTGSWFDPESTGQGFSLHFVSGNQFVVYFFGFTDSRERLWMIGVHDGGLRLGEDLSVPMFEATGGRFNGFDPGEVSELPWGQLEIRFHDCLNARVTLSGLDGFQEMDLLRLAGVEGLNCF